ncbi:MAG: DMT family transporter [Actinomycetales bacterium]
MNSSSSAIALGGISPAATGTLLAGLGVLSFSASFPATVVALESFGPWTATGLRGLLAAALAGAALLIARAPRPARSDRAAVLVVALGCVVGFPLLTSLALQTSSTAHSAVVIGALPMATAAISAVRTRTSPSPLFWGAAGVGAATVIAFAVMQNHGVPTVADGYLFAALLMCAAGYAEGGRLARTMPGWQVIAWAVVVAAPVSVAVTLLALTHEPVRLTAPGVAGLAYIAAISQFGGFVVWYRGMALIGVPRASQLQLAQPLLTLIWAVLLLGERFSATVPLTAMLVLACIVVTQRAR